MHSFILDLYVELPPTRWFLLITDDSSFLDSSYLVTSRHHEITFVSFGTEGCPQALRPGGRGGRTGWNL